MFPYYKVPKTSNIKRINKKKGESTKRKIIKSRTHTHIYNPKKHLLCCAHRENKSEKVSGSQLK